MKYWEWKVPHITDGACMSLQANNEFVQLAKLNNPEIVKGWT